jgi:hypothetical protein
MFIGYQFYYLFPTLHSLRIKILNAILKALVLVYSYVIPWLFLLILTLDFKTIIIYFFIFIIYFLCAWLCSREINTKSFKIAKDFYWLFLLGLEQNSVCSLDWRWAKPSSTHLIIFFSSLCLLLNSPSISSPNIYCSHQPEAFCFFPCWLYLLKCFSISHLATSYLPCRYYLRRAVPEFLRRKMSWIVGHQWNN